MSTTQQVPTGAVYAFAELNAAGDKIDVWFHYDVDLLAAVKAVSGARYHPPSDGGPKWSVPLNLDTGRRLREEMGDRLVLGKALQVWAKEQVKREKNLQTLASSDSVEAKDLELHKKIPALAEWMRPYQRADVKFLAATSALNLNEQRLGKTTEIIGAVFEAGLEDGPHLVCAPRTSLNTVWRFEIERWTEGLEKPHEVITYSGELSAPAKKAAIDEFWECVDEEWPVWFVCTFDTVRAGNEPFMDPQEFPEGWASFTIDEYHRSGLPNASGKKGTGSKFSDAVREVNAQRRYALSGTPMGGKPVKLWGGLHFLYPKQYTSKWNWAKNWLVVNSNGYGQDVGGVQRGREEEFYAAIAPYVVRRLRSEVLPQLPAAQWIDVWCDMTKKQAEQYKQFAAKAEAEIEDKKLNALGILAEYTRLKVFADAYCDQIIERKVRCELCIGEGTVNGYECHKCFGTGKETKQHPVPSTESGKLPYLLERLEEQGITAKKGEREGESLAIVSSQFKDVADMVHAWLVSQGIPAVKITGDTSDADRTRNQMMFRQDGTRTEDSPRVIVMTTTAGGVSITLDLVENVHILDETWVPDDQQQLADRAVNTSRMHQVGVYVYRSKNTIEEYIEQLNIEKDTVNKRILDIRRQGFRADMQQKQEARNAR